MFGFGKKKEKNKWDGDECEKCQFKLESVNRHDSFYSLGSFGAMNTAVEMVNKYQALVGDLRTENTNLKTELKKLSEELKKWTGREKVQFT